MIQSIRKNIGKTEGETGYTLIEVIIVSLIIGILLTIGTAHYLEARRLANEQLCATRLANIDAYQVMYHREYSTFATFEQLQEAGFIDKAYNAWDDIETSSVPYVPEYVLTFNVDVDSYQVVAQAVHSDWEGVYTRWRVLNGMQDVRSLYIDQDGVVRYLKNNRPVF